MLSSLLEKNILPDWLIRIGIRRLLKQRIKDETRPTLEMQQNHLMSFIRELKDSPVAVHTDAANEQHYEVPTAFYRYALGKHMKYSSGYWMEHTRSLDEAEETMLELTARRAELENGMNILELGCGWGSLTLYMAQRFPKSMITAVSNSSTQKKYIDEQAALRGLKNVRIITADMNEFTISETFDRIVSVEMFEHMRNYQVLLGRISGWLKPDGKLFVHIFTHKTFAYSFEVRDETDWMAKYFFTGGIMPSDHLLFYFNDHLTAEQHWIVDGTHYQKTSEAWLSNMDRNKKEIFPLFAETYGPEQATKWWSYWRIFFMACAELWGYRKGQEWVVSHYLFKKRNSQ